MSEWYHWVLVISYSLGYSRDSDEAIFTCLKGIFTMFITCSARLHEAWEASKTLDCVSFQNVGCAKAMRYLLRSSNEEWNQPRGEKYFIGRKDGIVEPSKHFDIGLQDLKFAHSCWSYSSISSLCPIPPCSNGNAYSRHHMLEVCNLLFWFYRELQKRVWIFKQCWNWRTMENLWSWLNAFLCYCNYVQEGKNIL